MAAQIDRLLFVAASSIASPADRRAFLEFSCNGNTALRELIEELLELEGNSEEFFEFEPTMDQTVRPDGEEESGVGARIGPYRLIDRLGAGGCGVVYLAEQMEPVKRKVALKVVRIGMDTENVIARFNMEREALALMDHPNIARVLDAGVTGSGRPYFAMELVDGEKITEYCDRKRLGLRHRLELFVQVCEAIQHAHQKGVIHRDIKPSNILVRDHDGRAVPKVIDFGIAKATIASSEAEATITRSGQFMGTPAYMSPEQADGEGDIDTRSDIYSLGAVLCELLRGFPPFEHEEFKDRGVEQIRSLIRDQEVGVPSAKLRTMPKERLAKIALHRAIDPHRLPAILEGDLDWIVMKAIEKDRSRRYEMASGFAMDVQRYLQEEAVVARPPSRWYLFSKLVRRNRALFAAGAVALIGLLGGLGVATWLFLRESDARRDAEKARTAAEESRAQVELARANESRLYRLAQSADIVTQAAVLIRYGEVNEADQLVSGLSVDQFPPSLESVNTLVAVANLNLKNTRWKPAADRFDALVHVLANVDMKDTDANSREWLPAATALKEWGDPRQYAELRKLALRRFRESTNSTVAEHLFKITLLEPTDAETLQSLASVAAITEGTVAGPNKEHDTHLVAWRQFTLALYAYRQGRLEDARSWSMKALAVKGSQTRDAVCTAILALIDLRYGRRTEALEGLEKVREDVRTWEAGPLDLEANQRLYWSNWAIARILLGEADALVSATGMERLSGQ
ncbi:serine/threonine protein kinase [Luteolibacter soli]|uniref:Serine/threonine-protein kinase n=1 Tax=Luteolibacter soli TaxID=3135280 RepID=A0ABU9APU0_9BACT